MAMGIGPEVYAEEYAPQIVQDSLYNVIAESDSVEAIEALPSHATYVSRYLEMVNQIRWSILSQLEVKFQFTNREGNSAADCLTQ